MKVVRPNNNARAIVNVNGNSNSKDSNVNVNANANANANVNTDAEKSTNADTKGKEENINIQKGDIVKIDEHFEFTIKSAKKEENKVSIISENFINNEKEKSEAIEKLMNDLLPKVEEEEKAEKEEKTREEEEEEKNNDNNITFEITLTKRQKDMFDKKGGVQWLKRHIDRVDTRKKKKKSKKGKDEQHNKGD